MECFVNYLHPELAALVPVLMIVGKVIKMSFPGLKSKIPLILMLISIPWALSVTAINGSNWLNITLTAIVQGIICAGMAVFGYEMFKRK